MRIRNHNRLTKVSEIPMDKLLLVARYHSYISATRFLNVSVTPLRNFMEKNHPLLHLQILANGEIRRKLKRNLTEERIRELKK